VDLCGGKWKRCSDIADMVRGRVHVVTRAGFEREIEGLVEAQIALEAGGGGGFSMPATVHKGVEGLGDVSSSEARQTQDVDR
jgi:hypothetical protein